MIESGAWDCSAVEGKWLVRCFVHGVLLQWYGRPGEWFEVDDEDNITPEPADASVVPKLDSVVRQRGA